MPEIYFKSNLPNWISYALTITGITGLTGAIVLYLYQCKLIYPASFPEGSRQQVAKPSEFGMQYTEITLTTKDKVNLKSYVILQPNEEEAKKVPTILYFHANAGNMGHRLPIAKVLFDRYNCNVVMLSYRGYGKSEGNPTEKGLKIDAQTMLEYVREHPILKNTPLIAYGQSIGGAVAIDLVSRNENSFSGLIIENTFLSLPKLIPSVLPFLKYLTFLCHQQWPSEKNIQRIVNIPILFLAGTKDELVPPSHMVKLNELNETRGEKVWASFPNGMHNDTCMQPGYFTAIKDFIYKSVLKEVDESSEVKQKVPRNTLDESYIDGRPAEETEETYQLVSGVVGEDGVSHSFELKEIKP
ncbi:Alpha/Beta hydrolase protein [Pilobolus umbonatus]|nr:Alpha/Beta hydrolase protein [Pilobolus umbonatus]